MATTFGTRPEDTVADSRGNVLSGVVIELYPTEADANARTSLVSSLTSDTVGLWAYSDTSSRLLLWARDPSGRVWPISSEEAITAAAAAAAAAAASATAAESARDDAVAATASIAAGIAPKLTGVAQSTAPDPSAGVWVDTGSTVPSVNTDTLTLLTVADTFTRADSTTTLGSPNIGPAWSALRGVWGISSNTGYMATHDAVNPANDTAVIDTGSADHIIEAKMVSSAPGLCVRVTDAGNGFVTNLTGLYRRETETNNLLVTFSTAFVAGDTMRMIASGTSIKVYRQASSAGAFALVGSTTSTFNQTATKAGMRTSSAASFDDVKAYALVAA